LLLVRATIKAWTATSRANFADFVFVLPASSTSVGTTALLDTQVNCVVTKVAVVRFY